MKKLFFLDLDGTFWDNEHIIPSTFEIFDLIHKNGHKVFVNSGRSRHEVTKQLFQLPFDGYVFASGTDIQVDGHQIAIHTLPIHLSKYLKEILDEYNGAYALQHTDCSYFNELGRKTFLETATYSDKEQIALYKSKSIEELKEEDYNSILKCFFVFREDKDPNPVLDNLPDELKYAVFFNESAEITSIHIDKGTAMNEVNGFLGNAYQTVAIGDSFNDVEMMEKADISICMGNGEEKLKEMCTYTAEPLHNDGLYKIIKELV